MIMGQCRRLYKDSIGIGAWAEIYGELARAERLSSSFPGVVAPSLRFFVDLMTGPDTHSWVLTFEQELAGMVYLTDVQGTSARIHFAFLPTKATRTKAIRTEEVLERLPVPVAVGRFAVASILRDRHGASGAGEHILDTLVGLTPVWNVPAVNMILRCGATALGVIPGACPDVTGRNTPGLITYFTRETTDDAWIAL